MQKGKAQAPSNLTWAGAYTNGSLMAPYISFISLCLNLETQSLVPEVGPDKGLVFPASSQLKDVLQKFCCNDETPALTL